MAETPAGLPDEPTPEDIHTQKALDYVRQALRGLRLGELRLIVQDGAVVQVERTERRRFPRAAN